MSQIQNQEMNKAGRRLFLKTLSAGLLTMLLPTAKAFASILTFPSKLPDTQSVYRVNGKVWVNGKKADINTHIGPNDAVKTGINSEIVFVVGEHAMLLRGSSHLVIHAKDTDDVNPSMIGSLRLLAGKLLSVSRNNGLRIETPTATIGIRGTGVYLEAGPEKTYFCTCYGEVDVVANNDVTSKESVVSKHHDKPLNIFRNGQPGQCIHDANRLTQNHTDEELILAEALIGRVPPFIS
jgi:hypothetical protein